MAVQGEECGSMTEEPVTLSAAQIRMAKYMGIDLAAYAELVDMTTPEGKVKQKVTKALKEVGAYYFYPVTGGYGRSGVPDVIACYQGRFFGIECKAGKNTTTALQDKNLKEIEESGGFSMVVNEDNVDNLLPLMVAWVNEEKI